jgi:WD40 repeat protein
MRLDADEPLPPGAVARLGSLRLRHQGEITGMALSADGKMMASASAEEKLLRLWNTDTGGQIRTIAIEGPGPINGLLFSPDGKILAASYRNDGPNLSLWHTATGKTLHRLSGHPRGVLAMAFQDAGKTLLSVGADAKLRCWDVEQGEQVSEADPTVVIRQPQGGTSPVAGFTAAVLAAEAGLLAARVHWGEQSQQSLAVWDIRQRKLL